MDRSLSKMRLLGRSQHLGHRRSQFLPSVFLHFGLPMPGLGELVVFRAPVILRCSPVRFDPAAPLQTMQGGIERPLLYLKYITRYLLDPLGYGPSMLGPKR